MLGWLSDIFHALVCLLESIGCHIVDALVWAINEFFIALAAAVAALVALLPTMPDIPELPDEAQLALGWIAKLSPIDPATVFQILTFLIGAWVLWQAAAILLRWMKALS